MSLGDENLELIFLGRQKRRREGGQVFIHERVRYLAPLLQLRSGHTILVPSESEVPGLDDISKLQTIGIFRVLYVVSVGDLRGGQSRVDGDGRHDGP